MSYAIPILLIVWRRPHTLRQVIDALRPVAPSLLYVACDGPNPERQGEATKVAATRQVIEEEIDWTCQINKFYSDVNNGCRLGVTRAINWFFEHVEEGIILEDDCVPHTDFFSYCASLLERYRWDSRVWGICGSNFQLGNRRGNASYYFSIHGDSWGWATWRRCWIHYRNDTEQWDRVCQQGVLKNIFSNPHEVDYWSHTLDTLFRQGLPDTWDYQWWLTSWCNHGLHAWPNTCLVSNVGFDRDATHTFGLNSFLNAKLQELGPITHPQFVLPDRHADDFAFMHRRGGLEMIERKKFRYLYPFFARLRKLKHQGLRQYLKNIKSKYTP